MGVPTSEVGYTPAMPRWEDHEVHKRTCGGTGKKKTLCTAHRIVWGVKPCAVMLKINAHGISIIKPTRFTNVSNLLYFGMTLYMFRTVFPSITSSSRLYIQLSNRYCCLLAYFGMTLYMFRTIFPSIISSSRLYIQLSNRYCCLLASVCLLANIQQYLFDSCMYSLELLMMDGKIVRNM